MAHGQKFNVRGPDGKPLREPLPERYQVLAGAMARNGDVDTLVGGMSDLYGPAGRKAIMKAVDSLDTAVLKEMSKGQSWEAMAEAIDAPHVDEETRQYVKGLISSMLVDDMTSVQGLLSVTAQETLSDGTEAKEYRLLYKKIRKDADQELKKKSDDWLACMLKGGGRSKCFGSGTLEETQNAARVGRIKVCYQKVRDHFKKAGKPMPVTNPSVARAAHVAEHGDLSVLDSTLTVQRAK
jgi:hypothetical protein